MKQHLTVAKLAQLRANEEIGGKFRSGLTIYSIVKSVSSALGRDSSDHGAWQIASLCDTAHTAQFSTNYDNETINQ